MRFAKLEPDPRKPYTDRMSFDCSCGFVYQQSDRARNDAVAD